MRATTTDLSTSRRLTTLSVILLATLGVADTGCRESTAPEEAERLWLDLIQANYRTNWSTAPGYENRVPSRAAHEDEVQIFINPAVDGALADGQRLDEWPVGALVAKDGYSGNEISLVAAMEKIRAGTEPETWFWAEYSGDGEVLFSGTPTICTGCHRIGDDFIRGFFFPAP